MITWDDVIDRITRIESKNGGGIPSQVRVASPTIDRIRFGKHHNSKQYVFKKRQPKYNGRGK